MITLVPEVFLFPATSRHRLEPSPTTVEVAAARAVGGLHPVTATMITISANVTENGRTRERVCMTERMRSSEAGGGRHRRRHVLATVNRGRRGGTSLDRLSSQQEHSLGDASPQTRATG